MTKKADTGTCLRCGLVIELNQKLPYCPRCGYFHDNNYQRELRAREAGPELRDALELYIKAFNIALDWMPRRADLGENSPYDDVVGVFGSGGRLAIERLLDRVRGKPRDVEQ